MLPERRSDFGPVSFFLVRPAGRTHLGVEVPRTPGKGVHREAESEGSRRQNATVMNKNRIRGTAMEMRRPISLKSNACLEGRGVYAARMSVEVGAHYPGRPRPLPMGLPSPRGGGKVSEESAEGIVGVTTRRRPEGRAERIEGRIDEHWRRRILTSSRPCNTCVTAPTSRTWRSSWDKSRAPAGSGGQR